MTTLSQINQEEAIRQFPVSMYLGVLAFIGLVGNGVVCYIYANVYKNSNSRCFIRWLAAIDLSTCLIAVPVEIVIVRNQYEFRLVWACKLSRFMNSLGTIASVAILVLIAIDRHRKICKSLGWQISNKNARRLCVLSFCLAVAVSLPNFWLYGIRTTTVSSGKTIFNGTECSISDDWKNSRISLIINGASFAMFLIAVLMLIILYSIIGKQVRFFARKREKRRLSSSLIIDANSDVTKSIKRRVIELRSPQPSDFSFSNAPNGNVSNIAVNSENLNKDGAMYKSAETILSSLSANSTIDRRSGRIQPPTAIPEVESRINSVRENSGTSSQYGLSTLVPLVLVDGKNINELKTEGKTGSVSKKLQHPPEKSTSGTDTLKTQPKNISKSLSKTVDGKRLARSTTYLMFLISLVFVLTFLPYLVLALSRELKPLFVENMTHAGRTAYRFFLRSYFMNCATNPILYSIFDRRFRSACCQTLDTIFRKLYCCRKPRR